jgi:hypothetical protein
MVGHYLYMLNQDGQLTGGGPVDPQLKRSWRLTHEPYSLKTADGSIQLTKLEPASGVMGMMADYGSVVNQLDDPTAEQGGMALTLAVSRNLLDKTYWENLGRIVDLTSSLRSGEPVEKKLASLALNPLTTVATGGPLVASVAKVMDPVQRDARTFTDQILAKVPGYSKDVPPLRDAFGDPILPPQAIGGKWLGPINPITHEPDQTDPLKKEAARLQVKVPMFPDSIGGKLRDDFDIMAPQPSDRMPVGLSPQLRDEWQQTYGNLIRSDEIGLKAQTLDNEVYQNAPLALQRVMYTRALAGYRKASENVLLAKHPDLAKQVMENQAGQYLPMMQQQEQDQAKAQISDTSDLLDQLGPEMKDNLLQYGVVDAPQGGH